MSLITNYYKIYEVKHSTLNRRRSVGHSGRIIFSNSVAPSVGFESSILMGTTGTGKTGFRKRPPVSSKAVTAAQDVISPPWCMTI